MLELSGPREARPSYLSDPLSADDETAAATGKRRSQHWLHQVGTLLLLRRNYWVDDSRVEDGARSIHQADGAGGQGLEWNN